METQTRTLTSLNPATLSPIGDVPMGFDRLGLLRKAVGAGRRGLASGE